MNRKDQFILFNPRFPSPPKVWFATFEEARRVAEEMASKEPGSVFYIMKAVSHTTTASATTTEYSNA